MDADGEHQPVSQPHGLADNIEMTIGDRIERSGEESDPLHGGGLARTQGNRKPRFDRSRSAATCRWPAKENLASDRAAP